MNGGPVRAVHALLAAAAIGLLVNVVVFGPGHLLGTSAYWDFPEADSQSNLVGYRYFLHEAWHWPLFEARTMNVPFPKSIAVTDSIPPFAALNKLVANVVPAWGPFSVRAYLGLWHGLVYALQAVCGVACTRALGHRTWSATVSTSLLVLAVPAFVNRYSHASLEAHFLLLWALSLYLRSPRGAAAPTPLRAAQVSELVIAALVNPCHLTMSAGIFGASLARARQWRTVVIWLPAAGAAVTAALSGAGFLAKETRVVMPGFDAASTNVLSPFIPIRSVLLGDRRGLADVFAAQYQYEGYAYLGLGVIVLVLLLAPRARDLRGVLARHLPLLLVALGAWLFALSNRIYLGSHVLLAFELPHVLDPVVGSFRAPGRFVWLPMYVGIVFVLHAALQHFVVGWRRLVVPAVALLQVVDGGAGDWAQRRAMTRAPFRHYLDLPTWTELVAQHDGVEVQPPYECGSGLMLEESVAREVHFVASLRGVPVNGVKSARPSRDCAADAARLADLTPSPGILYVFLPHMLERARRFSREGLACGGFYESTACSSLAPAIAAADAAGALRGAAGAGAKGPISFTSWSNAQLFETGWGPPLDEGRWTLGAMSTLVLRRAALPPHGKLRFEATALLCGDRQVQDVDVTLADRLVGTLHFDTTDNDDHVIRTLEVPDLEPLETERIVLGLRPRDGRTSRQVRCSEDDTALGLLVRRLTIE